MQQQHRNVCVLSINGQHHEIAGEHACMMLVDFLREKLRLVGTKIVCSEGDCGACSVLCWRDGSEPKVFSPINACIVPIIQLDCCHIITVEALKNHHTLSAIQQALVHHHGSQCGFCTPGFVIALTALKQNQKKPSQQQIKNALTGNLCRCTGYKPIIDAALSLEGQSNNLLSHIPLKDFSAERTTSMHIKTSQHKIYAPTTLKDALSYRKEHMSLIQGGATDLGVAHNKHKKSHGALLSLHLIGDLYAIKEHKGQIHVGARVTLANVRKFLLQRCPEIASFIDIFASPQIKTMATLVGNLANASPIGDTIPFLLVTDGQVVVKSLDHTRTIPLTSFYQGYKITDLKPNEIITSVIFSLPKSSDFFRLKKVSTRKDLDISTVNAAFLLSMNGPVVSQAKIAFGGVFERAIRLVNTEHMMVGKVLNDMLIEQVCASFEQELKPISDLRGSSHYRLALAKGLFMNVAQEMMHGQPA